MNLTKPPDETEVALYAVLGQLEESPDMVLRIMAAAHFPDCVMDAAQLGGRWVPVARGLGNHQLTGAERQRPSLVERSDGQSDG